MTKPRYSDRQIDRWLTWDHLRILEAVDAGTALAELTRTAPPNSGLFDDPYEVSRRRLQLTEWDCLARDGERLTITERGRSVFATLRQRYGA